MQEKKGELCHEEPQARRVAIRSADAPTAVAVNAGYDPTLAGSKPAVLPITPIHDMKCASRGRFRPLCGFLGGVMPRPGQTREG